MSLKVSIWPSSSENIRKIAIDSIIYSQQMTLAYLFLVTSIKLFMRRKKLKFMVKLQKCNEWHEWVKFKFLYLAVKTIELSPC